MNDPEVQKLISFACPDCISGYCYKMQTLPNFFKCDSCQGELFISNQIINLITKTNIIQLPLPKGINIKLQGSSSSSTS